MIMLSVITSVVYDCADIACQQRTHRPFDGIVNPKWSISKRPAA